MYVSTWLMYENCSRKCSPYGVILIIGCSIYKYHVTPKIKNIYREVMKWEILATICSVAIVQAHVGFKASVTDERFEDLWLRIEPYGSTQGFGTLVKSAGDRTNFKDPADEVDNLVLDGKKGLWVASVDSNNNNELVFNKQDWIREGGFSIGSERQLQVGKQFFWIFCHDKDDNKNHVYFEGEIGTIKNIPNNCARGVLTGHF